MDPAVFAFFLTIAVCVALTVWAIVSRRREAPRAPARVAPGETSAALLAGLPPDLRAPLEQMLTAHADEATGRETPGEESLLAQTTELVSAAIPLAVEAARLNDYLARFDLDRLRLEAVRDPSRRAVISDLERMSERRDLLRGALERAAQTASGAATPTAVADEAHRLRLL